MEVLRNSGAKLALDDFGTGYSNLNYLHRFPVDYLKIDKAFVDGIMTETSGSGLIDHIISIAGTMQLELIAEGIEHEYQMSYLKERGVRFGQGWHFAKALPFEKFAAFLQEKMLKINEAHLTLASP
jgi:sensor c-di-GMP phosphodiesterase-like protein